MRLTTILRLIAKKYPTDYAQNMNPVLFIYDDESGAILKNALKGRYETDNVLFSFSDVDELIAHLQEP